MQNFRFTTFHIKVFPFLQIPTEGIIQQKHCFWKKFVLFDLRAKTFLQQNEHTLWYTHTYIYIQCMYMHTYIVRLIEAIHLN